MRSQSARTKRLIHDRMWTLACLQRAGAIEFMGLHPRILARHRTTREEYNLHTILSDQGGYSGVVQVLRSQSEEPNLLTPANQERLAVIRFCHPIENFEQLRDSIVQGHTLLIDRHRQGEDELRRFIENVRDGDCVKRQFAPAIGLEIETTQTCLQELDAGEVTMPCSNCRRDERFEGTQLGNYDEFIWSTEQNIALLMGDDVEIEAPPVFDPRTCRLSDLPEPLFKLEPDNPRVTRFSESSWRNGPPRRPTDSKQIYTIRGEPLEGACLLIEGKEISIDAPQFTMIWLSNPLFAKSIWVYDSCARLHSKTPP